MIRYSHIFRGLIFTLVLALAASSGLAQNGKGKGHEKKAMPKEEKDKPGKDKMNEMYIKLMSPSPGGYGKDGGYLKYSWKYQLAREAMLKKSWSSVKVWYNNGEVVERIEEIRLDDGYDSIQVPYKANYYPDRYEIKLYADYTYDGKPRTMSDMMSGKLPKMMDKDGPIIKR